MNEKKVVSRTTVFALVAICVILAGGLVGAVAYYNSMISGKDSTIATQTSQISSLQSQVNSLTNMIYLKNSSIWVNNETTGQAAGSYTSWTFSASYAGYVEVNVKQIFVQNSNFNWLYVQVIYSYTSSQGYQFNYNNTISLDRWAFGTAAFPILPSSGVGYPYVQPQANSIQVRVGNYNNQIQINPPSAAYEAVTIKYFY